MNKLNSNRKPITEGRQTPAFDLSANGYGSTSTDCAKQGYTVLGITNVDIPTSNDIDVMKFSTVSDIAYIRVRNTSSSYVSNITINVRVLYIKN